MNEPRMGWICPRCNVVKSPDVTECKCQTLGLDLGRWCLPQETPAKSSGYGTATACGDYDIINGNGETLP